jgi:hypothetical protein
MRKLPVSFSHGKPPDPASQIGTASRMLVEPMKSPAAPRPPMTAARGDHGETARSAAMEISNTPSRY